MNDSTANCALESFNVLATSAASTIARSAFRRDVATPAASTKECRQKEPYGSVFADVVVDGALEVSATFVIHVCDSTVISRQYRDHRFHELDPARVARLLNAVA